MPEANRNHSNLLRFGAKPISGGTGMKNEVKALKCKGYFDPMAMHGSRPGVLTRR
jgi:hypothetical protein